MSESAPRPTIPAGRIRCEKHNISYNPATTNGCALCAAETVRKPRERDGLPISPLAAVMALALGGVLVAGVTKAGRALASRGEAVYEDKAETAGKLNPAQYQGLVSEIEDLVFSANRPGFDHGSRIFRAAMSLSEAIRANAGGNPLLDARLSEHSHEILAFGQMMSASEEMGYVAFDLHMAQRDWQTTRDRVFLEADWFHESNAPTVTTGAASPAAVSDPAAVRALGDMALEMESLIRFARSSALAIGEPRGARDDWETRRLDDQWQNFRSSIGGRLRSVIRAIPAGQYQMTTPARQAHRYLESSANAIGSLVQSTALPNKARRQQFVDQADRYLAQARQALQKL